jgi:hypothetical protein
MTQKINDAALIEKALHCTSYVDPQVANIIGALCERIEELRQGDVVLYPKKCLKDGEYMNAMTRAGAAKMWEATRREFGDAMGSHGIAAEIFDTMINAATKEN